MLASVSPMLAPVATVLGLLVCAVVLAALSSRSRIPYPTIMVCAGLVIAVIPGIPQIKLNPDVIFLVFLPPILYAAAWNTWWEEFKRNFRDISLLAIGLVLFTTAGVALAAQLTIPGMSWAGAFLLGAIVSPPDAAAATAICQRLGVSRKIVSILEGESLVNDATGLICYKVAIGAIAAGSFSIGVASADLVAKSLGGIALGVAVGWLIVQIHSRIRDATLTTAISLLAPYLAYLPGELLGVSGVLATVAAGLYVSRRSPQFLSPQARLQAVPVWELLILLLNGLIFVLIGLQLNSALTGVGEHSTTSLLWYAGVVCAATILTRVVWVFASARLTLWLGAPRSAVPNAQSTAVISWTGMRGIVSLAAAMALPETTTPLGSTPFPLRDLTILLTFAVIFATLVAQSFTLPPLIRWFGESVSGDVQHEEIIARLMVSNAALARLEPLTSNPAKPAMADSATRVRAAYMNRIDLATSELVGGLAPGADIAAEAENGRDGGATARDAETAAESQQGRRTPDDPVRLMAVRAEREALVALRIKGEISEDIFRRIEKDLDLEEGRLT